MADSTEGHTDMQNLGLLAPALIALIAGLVIHSFIIGVNVTDWWKGRPVTPVDHVVTSLGISRMCSQCASILFIFMHALSLRVPLIISLIHDFFVHANVWLTSLLSIVLCLKISNFHNRLFLYLRGVIAHRTVYFIGAAVLLSALNSLMLVLVFLKATNADGYNGTMNCTDVDSTFFVHFGGLIPILFYYISLALLTSSLYHHITKMKMSSNLSINLETYYSVMKFLAFTCIYSTMYFICCCFALSYFFFFCIILYWLTIVLEFLSVLHSSYLIYRTAKLKSQMSEVLQKIIDFLFKKKSSET